MKKAIFKDGVTDYKIITAAEPSKFEHGIAQSIADVFKNLGEVEISVSSEYTDGKKIIVGNVDTDKTAASIKASLSETDYTVRFIDDVLYLIGGSDASTAKAWSYVRLNFMHKDMDSLYIEDGFVYNSNLGKISSLTINGNDIKKYTIVHYDGYFAQKCANDIKTAIFNKTGIELAVVDDSAEECEYEILVGKTNRAESKEIRAKYDRPHIYYDVAVSNNKLVVMAEGYTTLEMVSVELEAYLNSMTETDINGSIISRNIKYYIDVAMIDVAEDSDLRVWCWNMEAPYIHHWHNQGAVYFNDKIRGEIMADVLATHFPDIIGTNEYYNSHIYTKYQDSYSSVLKELSDYYVILDESPYEYGKPDENSKPDWNYGMPENILYKKTSRFSFVKSCWRYTPTRAGCHGYHQAIFELANGQRFMYSVGHYGASHQDDTCALAHIEAINDMQAKSGSEEPIPVILAGDLFTYHGDVGYNALTAAGYIDSQRTAEINGNGDVTAESYHGVGRRYPKNGCCDFIFYTKELQAKKFALMYSVSTDDTSDHYPTCADLKFK